MTHQPSKSDDAKKLAQRIHDTFASAYAIGEKINHDWLVNVIEDAFQTKDREREMAVEEERENWKSEARWLYHYLKVEPNEKAVSSLLEDIDYNRHQ